MMFVDNAVVKKFEGEERYDLFVIAGALSDMSFNGAACSLIESKVLKNYEGCNLKFLCNKINGVVKEYTERTTVVTESFEFNV